MTEQQEFRGAVRDVLSAECSPEALRGAWESADGRVRGLWRTLADLGLFGLLVPEDSGGLGMDEVVVVGALEECGWFAVPEPVAETLVVAAAASTGDAAATLGFEDLAHVPYAETAEVFLLERDGRLSCVARDDVRITPQSSTDRLMPLSTVEWSPSSGTAVDADPMLVRDRMTLFAAAQLVGLAQGMLERAVAYAKTREQFGVAIGSFQAVKHQLADVYIGVEFARPLVERAAWSVARAEGTRSRDVSMAAHHAALAAKRSARTALQVHGGIGYTFENDLHMWLKRVWTLVPLWADPVTHLARVAAAVI